MARTTLIPLRPKNFVSSLSQEQQTALTWYVLSGCSRIDAVVTFARPDLALSRGKPVVDEYTKQFFAQKTVKDYLDAYSTTLNEFLHPAKVEEKPKASLEERKAATKAKLVEFAMQLADDIESAEDKEAVLKIADKVGLLDSDEEVVELPRRYLPVSCLAECRYRLFVEENCEDECQFCRYKKYSEDNGVHFKNEEMLDVPIKVAESE